MKVTSEEILQYELPLITEYVSWPPLQTVIARYTAWKVNLKMKRYEKRRSRQALFLSRHEEKLAMYEQLVDTYKNMIK